MIIFKFTKTSTSALAAHVDTLRAVTYLVRRANIDAAYSQGFNPHIELGFSPPLPLGVESYAEYVSVKAEAEENLLERVNAVCPQGMTFTRMWTVNVNLAAKITKAKYIVTATGIGDVVSQLTAPNYTLVTFERDKEVRKDVSARIFDVVRTGTDAAEITLAVGNENLRPDRIVNQLMRDNGLCGDCGIVKVDSYVGDVPTDEYLDELQAARCACEAR